MKKQLLFTSLSMAVSLVTVESFLVPLGTQSSSSRLLSSSLSSDGFGLRKMSKELMQQKKEDQQATNDPAANDVASRFMSFATSSPNKPLTTSISQVQSPSSAKRNSQTKDQTQQHGTLNSRIPSVFTTNRE
ncbi:unnamed protein product [Cylindrotheca closterium]|uniref:RxLR effector protein n=1 Tax=Cylindrotheca closterium TaxID=2856 RepID=A0AAD2JL56_9STRA|nr:unnamed protein product [Cylindrotheca closterium]